MPDDHPSTFMSATGQPFQSKGHFEIPFLTENHHKRSVTYLDAPVSMPIVSSHRWAEQGHRGILDEDSGQTVHKETGEEDQLVLRNGT